MTTTQHQLVRGTAATAALVLAALSRGDAIVLAALLLIAVSRPLALAVVPALLAASWRFASTSLEAVAGAQAVLGPAGLVGPVRAAAASWLAATALVLCTPAWAGLRTGPTAAPARALQAIGGVTGLTAAALGAAAAAVVAGPSLQGDWWVRVLATGLAVALGLGVGRLRQWRAGPFDALALAAALGAVALGASEAPTWSGTVDAGAARSGLVLAAAVAAVASVGSTALRALGNRGT